MSLSEAFNSVLNPSPVEQVDLVSMLARKLESKREVPIPTPEGIYRTSRLVKMCPREEVLRYLHQVKKFEVIEARLQRVFDFGTALHEFVQNNWFAEWLIGHWRCDSCLKEYSGRRPEQCECGSSSFRYKEIQMLDEQAGISGHTDGVLEINGRKIVLEIKTCSSKQFELIRMRNAPLQAHLDQVQIYMWLLGLAEAMIIYIEKDESLLAQFSVHKNESVARSFLKRVWTAKEGMLNRAVPERELCESSKCARAKACSTRSLCFS